MQEQNHDQRAQDGGKLNLSVRVYPAQPDQDSKLLATAVVTLGGCFAVRGVRILDSEKGAFVSMPQRKTAGGEYRDVCFPTTAELRGELTRAVLGAYQKSMEQGYTRAEQAIGRRESVLKQLSEAAAEVPAPRVPIPHFADKGRR